MQKSYQKELLDATDIPFEAIQQNMVELNFINTWLGGHAISIKGFKQLINGVKKTTLHSIVLVSISMKIALHLLNQTLLYKMHIG